jgi:hypothetical protein
MKNGLILFYREEDLPPGNYTVEAAAYDLPSNKISVRKTSIDVPDADETKLRLSSIVIVKRGEQLAKIVNPTAPFWPEMSCCTRISANLSAKRQSRWDFSSRSILRKAPRSRPR